LRDQRLRGHFKERYDHRKNLVDWDFNFGLNDFTKSVHQREYKMWRLNGIAF
jgi:dynein assembly factor 3, axonemal